jgi:hypothetical protein
MIKKQQSLICTSQVYKPKMRAEQHNTSTYNVSVQSAISQHIKTQWNNVT